MRNRPSRWLVVALAELTSQWPGVAPGQNGAPIPLLPPTVTAPPAPATPYQAAPPTPYQAAPPSPYEAAPAAPYQTAPAAPYQEAPAAPPSQQSAPIVATPLAPAISPSSAAVGYHAHRLHSGCIRSVGHICPSCTRTGC